MRKRSIEDSALIVLLTNYLSKSFVSHAVMRQKCNILRAGICFLIHESVSVDEVRGIEMEVLGQSIHVVHKQSHVSLALDHECFKESHLLSLSLANSHPSQ